MEQNKKMLRKLLKANGTFHLNTERKNPASNAVHSSMHCATCKYLEDIFFVRFFFGPRVFLFHKCIEPKCVAILIFKRRRNDEIHIVL